ncbi:sigma-70 family RNA polymerase sigma factor [Sorangium sp. So ce1036]|uniref:RNA polymerase sigma factor n=1 Tax=Sorangium sp. So ce1036 TaxID=3133328 RepID=UPI003F0E4175
MESTNDPDDILGRVSHLVRAERAALASLARAEGVTPEDAVDCVQEGLCTLLTLAQGGALPEDVGAWGGVLAGIVRNAARNRRRRHFRARPHVDLDAHPEAATDTPATDDAIARAEEHVRLRACVEELCEIQKAVVTLRMLEEQPGEDVARALGISAGHVAVLLHRAKAALRACMTTPP